MERIIAVSTIFFSRNNVKNSTKMADRLHFFYSCLRSPSRLQCSVWSQISNGDPNRGDLVTRIITKRKCKCKLAERKETKYFLMRMRRASLHVFLFVYWGAFMLHLYLYVSLTSLIYVTLLCNSWLILHAQTQWIFEEERLRVELIYISLFPTPGAFSPHPPRTSRRTVQVSSLK